MKLVEDFKANSVSLDTSLWVNGSQVSLRHANDVKFFICNDLVTNCKISVSESGELSTFCAYYRMISRAKLCQLQDRIQRKVILLPSCC
jgi:hypothetical protein